MTCKQIGLGLRILTVITLFVALTPPARADEPIGIDKSAAIDIVSIDNLARQHGCHLLIQRCEQALVFNHYLAFLLRLQRRALWPNQGHIINNLSAKRVHPVLIKTCSQYRPMRILAINSRCQTFTHSSIKTSPASS